MDIEIINRRLKTLVAEKGVLIATHRGAMGGNIVENTLPSYLAAINMGTDIVEMDVPMTLDGQLICIHDGMEKRLFRTNHIYTPFLPGPIAFARHYMNQSKNRLKQTPNRFGEVLDALKGRCIINVDRCWAHWGKVMEEVKKRNMEDCVIFKCVPSQKYLDVLAAQKTPYIFMPVIKKPEHLALVAKYNLNVPMVEFVFSRPDSPIIDPSLLAKLKSEGKFLWGNAIDIREGGDLCAGYDDYVSLTDDPEKGWGKLVAMGFDIIQTDFPAALHNYLVKKGVRKA